jgi:deoxyribonuclease IV
VYLGVHVSISGSIYESIDRAQKLGCTAMQIFSRNPRGWRQGGLDLKDVAEFKLRRKKSDIEVVAVHVPYLTNLAAGRDELYKHSIESYIEDIRDTALLGAQYLVTHMGSHKDITLSDGIARFTKALNVIIKETVGLPVKLLLENTSGSGSWLGSTFSDHRKIFEGVEDKSRLGVCLDTAHVFAAGYDIRKPEVFDDLLEEIDTAVGKESLKLIHLNDSMADLGSKIDRHQHLGKGFIGLKAFKHIVNHPRLKKTAFILETPKDTPRADVLNLNRVRRLLNRVS